MDYINNGKTYITDVEEYFYNKNRFIMIKEFSKEFIRDLENNDVKYYLDDKFTSINDESLWECISDDMILVTAKIIGYYNFAFFIHEKDAMWVQIKYGLNI